MPIVTGSITSLIKDKLHAKARIPIAAAPARGAGERQAEAERGSRHIKKSSRARPYQPRFVTGVTWVEGELWHGTWENDESDLRRIDPQTGEVLERLEMPPASACRGSSPMAPISSSAAAEAAARCEPFVGLEGDELSGRGFPLIPA